MWHRNVSDGPFCDVGSEKQNSSGCQIPRVNLRHDLEAVNMFSFVSDFLAMYDRGDALVIDGCLYAPVEQVPN